MCALCLEYVCLCDDMLCRRYACYVHMMLSLVYILIFMCRYAQCTSGASGICLLIVVVWVGPQDATLIGLQRIMRRRGGSQSDTTPRRPNQRFPTRTAWRGRCCCCSRGRLGVVVVVVIVALAAMVGRHHFGAGALCTCRSPKLLD